MKIVILIARILLGLMFIVTGLNVFLNFIPAPPPTGLGGEFANALMVSRYMYVIGLLQIAGGALLLIGRWVPLGLTLLGPVIVNILLFHVFLEPAGLITAIVVSVLALFLLWAYWPAFRGLVTPYPSTALPGSHTAPPSPRTPDGAGAGG
jgi:uncharacterized membrane protein YphA (DoxX/SURF4 family)